MNNRKERNKRISNRIVCFMGKMLAYSCLVFMTATIHASAIGNVRVMQCHTGEKSLLLYIKTDQSEIDDVKCQIGRYACDNVNVLPVTERNVPLRTVFLLDNSLSIASKYRPMVTEIITGIIDGHVEGEEFRIATIDTDIHYLSEYSSDYAELITQINGIEYNNQDTYFTDVLYYELQRLQQDQSDVYTRIVAVSDGTEDMSVGIKTSELSDMVQNDNIPVYSIGVPYKNNDDRLSNMFSISRRTNAEAYNLEQIGVDEIIQGISADRTIKAIEIFPQQEQLDGSKKSMKLTLQSAEENKEVTLDARMPFGDIVTPVDNNDLIVEPEDVNKEDQVVEPVETEEIKDAEKLEEEEIIEQADTVANDKGNGLPIGKILLAILAIAAGVAALIWQKKKKETSETGDNKKNKKESAAMRGGKGISIPGKEKTKKEKSSTEKIPNQEDDDKTVILEDLYKQQEEDDDRTVILEDLYKTDSSGQNEVSKPEQKKTVHSITITDITHGEAERRFRTERRIVLGRAKDLNDFAIPQDERISSQHCYIETDQSGCLTIVDLNSSNGVYCDGFKVTDRAVLNDGSEIGIGDTKLLIRIVD